MSSFLILALATSALAVPFGGEHAHHKNRQHNHFHPSGYAAPSGYAYPSGYPSGYLHPSGTVGSTGTGGPYPIANATGYWRTTSGTGAGSGLPSGFPMGSGTVPVSQVAAVSSVATCSGSTAYVTVTNQVTVTVQYSSSSAAEASAVPEETSASMSVSMDVHNKGFDGGKYWHRKSTTVSSSASSSVLSYSSSVAYSSTSSIVEVAPTVSSSSSVEVAPTVASSSSVYVAPTTSSTTSVYVAPTSSSSISVYVAPTSSSVVASSTTSSSVASQSASSGTGKRGVAYNDASLTTPFEDSSEVTWGYNWGQSSSGLSSKFNFVPLLWGTGSTFTSAWDDTVAAAADNGVTHLMSFNEPDMSSQANMSPEDAATAYKKYMQPHAGKFKLGSPAVTNGGGAMGLGWLDAFLNACDGCTIDFVPIHWYDSASNTEYFKAQVQNATDVAGGKPVWVTEFGCTSGSDSDISTFLEEVMPWMDSQDFVERYAYFMVTDGKLVSGSEVSSYGNTYMSYTGSS